MEEPAEAVILVGQDAPPAKRLTRAVKPSSKVREATQQADDIAEKTKRSARSAGRPTADDAAVGSVAERRRLSSSTSVNEGRVMLQLALDLLAESREEIKWLKQVITEEREMMNNQRQMIQELTRQAKETSDELQHVRDKLDTIAASSTLTSTHASPKSSYADVARPSTSRRAPDVRAAPSGGAMLETSAEMLHCTIDTSRVEDSHKHKAQIANIRRTIENEMRSKEEDSTWRCAAVTKDPKNADRIRIICRNETELKRVKQVAEATAVAGSRVMRDQLYPVRVDNANRSKVLSADGSILPGAIEALSTENSVQIAKIAWLSNKDSGKAYGSMAIYVTKRGDAQKLLGGLYFDIAGESAYTHTFEPRAGPVQCYNCQELGGHKAFACKKPQVCGKCAQTGHHHSECRAVEPRCVPCGGPHESYSVNCPKRSLRNRQ